MTLRVTQEYISVLGQQDGELRVSQQYISVLGTTPADDELRVTQSYISVLSLEGEDPDPPGTFEEDLADIFDPFDIFEVTLIRLEGDVDDVITLEDQYNLVFTRDLQDEYDPVDEFYIVHQIDETITLDDEFVVSKLIALSDELPLDDDLSVTQILGRTLEDEIGITDNFYAFIPNQPDCDYAGFGLPAAPTLGSATLTLTYPYASPTTTLVLRNPQFGDTHAIAHQRVYIDSRGGVPDVFKDPDWPVTEVLTINVEALNSAQASAFLQLMSDCVGDEIGLLDHYNRQWRGIILTPDAEVTDAGNCKKLISFQFEGTIQ